MLAEPVAPPVAATVTATTDPRQYRDGEFTGTDDRMIY